MRREGGTSGGNEGFAARAAEAGMSTTTITKTIVKTISKTIGIPSTSTTSTAQSRTPPQFATLVIGARSRGRSSIKRRAREWPAQ